ncbi:MAG: GNAT family N-acetyltransferase [Fidelibacterota bacterium]
MIAPDTNVVLRPLSEKDIPFWKKLLAEPQTREHQPLTDRSIDELRRQLNRYAVHDLNDPHHREYKWVAFDAESRVRVGVVSFDRLHIGQKIGRIGYSIAPQWWGMGFGTMSVKTLVDKIFRESDCQRIEAECSIYNTASCKVLEKNGFIREGTKRGYLEIHGVRVDHYSFGLLRSDWEGTDN